MFATFGGLSQAAPAQAQSTFVWGTGAGQNDWQAGSLDGGAAQPYQVDGVTINFLWTGATTTFLGGQPALSSDAAGSLPITGTEVTGGLAEDNLLVIFNPTTFAETVDLQATFTNAAGNSVPLDNLQYTIVDIDRDNGRVWQDVISTTGSLVGGTVTPTVVPGTLGETIEVISGDADAIAYTEPAGAITFRGITDPDAASEPQEGDSNPAPPIADDSSVEANNQNNEGNVTIAHLTAVDRIDIVYGNGTPFAVNGASGNGLGFDLNNTTDPGAHGAGFLGDFSFFPGIIGVAKSATTPVVDTDPARSGNFLTTFTVTVENLGGVDLNSVQVTDDLSATFPGGFVVTSAPVVSSPTGPTTSVVGNTNFGVGGDQNLLTGGAGSVLDEDDGAGGNGSATITFTVSFNPAGATSFNNQATATGITPGGGTTTDLSDDGTVVDPNGNSDPTDPGEQDPTPIVIPSAPRIGVTKQVIDVTPVGGGQFDVTYRHIVQNVGTIPLTGVQLTENLTTTFRQGLPNGVTDYSVTSIRIPTAADATNPNPFEAGGAAPNADYVVLNPAAAPGGTNFGNFTYLTGADGLQPGQFGVVDFVTRVTPGTNLGDGPAPDVPFEGQVTATGTGNDAGNTVVTDLSDDVTEFINDPANQFPSDLNGDLDTTDPDGELDPPADLTLATTPTSSAGRNLLDPALADPDGASENDRTPVAFLPPQIGVTKQVSSVVGNPDGTYTITYRQIVRNLGNEPIGGVALTENDTVANTFRQGTATGVTSAAYVPNSLTVPGAAPAGFPAGYVPLTGTPAFDGAGNLQLATVPTLPVGGYGIVDYQVIVDPTDPLDPTIENLGDGATTGAADDTPYISQATVTGTGAASGLPTSDLSDDSSNFNPGTTVPSGTPLPVALQLPRDENGNLTATDGAAGPGTPGGPENDPSPLSLAPQPQIGLTKQVTNIIDNGDGSFDVVFDYVVQNQGQVPLNGLTISDNYDDQFNANDIGPVANYEVISVTPGASTAPAPLTADTTAPGQTQGSGLIPLANGTTTVYQPGQQSTAQVVVRVFNPDLSAVYDANALASATSAVDGSPTTDLSDNVPQFGAPGPQDGIFGPGSAPGDPNDPANTQTSVLFSPLQLFKRITSVTRSGVTTNFSDVVGTVPDQSFVGEIDIRNQEDLQIGDSVEYTIYYFNASGAAINNVELCDPVPSPLTIINGSLTATPVAPGTVISPLTPLSPTSNPGRSCGASSGTQGAAVFDVGNIAPASGGFVRFSNLIQ